MEDELSEKQTYLRENVLEKGFDAENFMQFLQTKKGDSGLDLNIWSLEELKQAVSEFISEKSNTNSNIPPPDEPNKNLNESPEIHEEEHNFEENDYNNNYNETNENENDENEVYDLDKFNQEHPYEPTINIKEEYGKCQLTEITTLSTKDNIKVTISFPEKVDGNIFSKSFVSYLIQTDPFGFRTRKRYSDFDWLRKTLQTVYTNCVLPPLCKKKIGDRFSEYLIAKRMRSIEKFMQGIVIHPLLKNSQILYDFLSIHKEEEFNKKKVSYGKLTSPVQVKDFKTLEGEIKMKINQDKETYFLNIKDNCTNMQHLLHKITRGYKSLTVLMQQASEKMKEISEVWKQVADQSTKYKEDYNTIQAYDIMSTVMTDWSEAHKKEINLINLKIREYFRYIKNEYSSLLSMGRRVDSSKMLYTKAFDKLYNTKEGLYKQQDLTLWGLSQEDMANKLNLLKNKDLAFEKMLPKETKKVNEFKYFYGSLLNSMIGEYERIRGINCFRHKNDINKFIRELSDQITEFHVSLADRMSQFSDKMNTNNFNSFTLPTPENNYGNDF